MTSGSLGLRRLRMFACLAIVAATGAQAAPVYDQSGPELEAVLADLVAWLPGAWDSYPQVHYERTVRVPVDGEHEHWYRTFARIDAPQLGAIVFYGQINVGGRDGPMMPRSQILYRASIDESRGVVLVEGQSPADAEQFQDLERHPELWPKVRMRDADAINCDFIWRRDGAQLVGVLDGKDAERRKFGPGTCNYTTPSGVEFYADAEWVLTPELLWVYDINKFNDQQFIGRADRTHIRMYRAREYTCHVRDRDGARRLDAYDRGYTTAVVDAQGRARELMLLRADYPRASVGLADRLRLSLHSPGSLEPLRSTEEAPRAARIALQADGIDVSCALATR